MLRFAEFEIALDRGELRTQNGETIRLRPKTFALLCLFATNANRLLSKQELTSAIWPNVHIGDDSLFQCIREIRTALGDADRQMIRSMSGRGYLFNADVTDVMIERDEVPAPVKPASAEVGTAPPPDLLEAPPPPCLGRATAGDRQRRVTKAPPTHAGRGIDRLPCCRDSRCGAAVGASLRSGRADRHRAAVRSTNV